MVYWCMSFFFRVFSLLSPLFFSLSSLSLSFLLLSCRGLLLLSFMATSSFYSELIPWDFSLLPLELHQLFLVSCGHPFKTVNNPLVARPLPLLSTFSLYHYSFHNKISFCLILLQTSTSGFKWIRIWLPYHLPLWHASGGPSRLPHLLGKIPSQQNIFPKEALAGNQWLEHWFLGKGHGLLGFPYFFSSLPGLVCLLGISSCQTNSLDFCSSFFLFPRASITYWLAYYSLFFHHLMCSWTCWLIGLYFFLWTLIAHLLYFNLLCAYGPVGYHFLSCWPIRLLPIFLGFYGSFALLLPLIVPMG